MNTNSGAHSTTQRLAFAAAAGLVAFVVVLLGAVGLYLALAGPAGTAALAASGAPQSAPSAPAAGGDTTTADSYPVSADQAANIALNSMPGATLLQPLRLVNVNGTIAYEVTLDRGLVYIDANQGQVLYNGAGGSRRRPRR